MSHIGFRTKVTKVKKIRVRENISIGTWNVRTLRPAVELEEWTVMDFASSARATEDRTRWKEMVAKLSVVPTLKEIISQTD